MVAGGNAVVFNVHPSAGASATGCVHLLNEAIVGAGGPENLLVRHRRADHRERAGADEASAGAHPRRHRRPGRRQGGDELGQARHRRRPGQSARRRRRDGAPRHRRQAASSTARRSTTTSSASPRRKCWRSSSICDRLKEQLVREGCYLMNDKQVRQLEKRRPRGRSHQQEVGRQERRRDPEADRRRTSATTCGWPSARSPRSTRSCSTSCSCR